jgi:hypothetical protein
MPEAHEGGCLCGAIRFRTEGAPRKATVCHCALCQRTTGSAFSIELLFPKSAVAFQGAVPSTYTYRSPDHGRLLHYLFCPTCGTRLGLTLERFPAIQIIYAGTYDDPMWVKPDSHILLKSAVSWVAPPPDTDCYSAHMLSEDGSPIQPLPRV